MPLKRARHRILKKKMSTLVTFVLDHSGSMSQFLQPLRIQIDQLISKMNLDAHCIGFSGMVVEGKRFCHFHLPSFTTDIEAGLRAFVNHHAKPENLGRPCILVFVSDGEDDKKGTIHQRILDLKGPSNCHMLSIGVGMQFPVETALVMREWLNSPHDRQFLIQLEEPWHIQNTILTLEEFFSDNLEMKPVGLECIYYFFAAADKNAVCVAAPHPTDDAL